MKSLEDTVTALECCCQYNSCIGCPYASISGESVANCVKAVGTDALLHLIRLKARSERLEDLEK